MVSTRLGSDDPIGLCRRLLGRRDFSGCRNYALMARESNPNSRELAQILAIVDVLLAAQRRTFNDRLDYYSILKVTRPECESGYTLLTRFKKLMENLSPSRNKFPFSDEAVKFVCQAWSVLSKSDKRNKYDLEITNGGTNDNAVESRRKRETHMASDASRGEDHKGKLEERTLREKYDFETTNDGTNENKVGKTGKRETHLTSNANRGEDEELRLRKRTLRERERKDQTFWTVCPYCCVLYEYAIVYKEGCLRCQNCRRVFQGMPVGPLPANLVAEGVDKYYCGLGFFNLRHAWDGFFIPEENNRFPDTDADRVDNWLEISDDSDGEENDNNAKEADLKTSEKGVSLKVTKEESRLDNNENAEKADQNNIEKDVRLEEVKEENIKREGVMLGRLNGRRVKTTAKYTKKGIRMAMKKIRTTETNPGEKKSYGNGNVGDMEFFKGN